ncbi:hypothetical protein M404DRAFT_998615 [Pisolithus tinctorius Marx 270]|uniref:Uncharacterized protein n=1 Tax=Pisolithus tinctorius Marx 270 TaxID=870435 RepID=A0A0C3JDR1_PISTI|nr:hypothetical protein M404DRAFT_998615 [Pisolithus tinctorius Marx 270]
MDVLDTRTVSNLTPRTSQGLRTIPYDGGPLRSWNIDWDRSLPAARSRYEAEQDHG